MLLAYTCMYLYLTFIRFVYPSPTVLKYWPFCQCVCFVNSLRSTRKIHNLVLIFDILFSLLVLRRCQLLFVRKIIIYVYFFLPSSNKFVFTANVHCHVIYSCVAMFWIHYGFNTFSNKLNFLSNLNLHCLRLEHILFNSSVDKFYKEASHYPTKLSFSLYPQEKVHKQTLKRD